MLSSFYDAILHAATTTTTTTTIPPPPLIFIPPICKKLYHYPLLNKLAIHKGICPHLEPSLFAVLPQQPQIPPPAQSEFYEKLQSGDTENYQRHPNTGKLDFTAMLKTKSATVKTDKIVLRLDKIV